jgi:CheY-like chemotaxis protein
MASRLLRTPQLEDAERQWAQGVIERQAHTLTRLVDDLVDVSRISRGKIALRKEPMDLSLAVNGAIESTRPLLEEHRHELNISIPSEPIPVNGDPIRLEQLVVNLLTNAIKYTQPGGHIWIRAAVENETATISVRDTGIGIPSHMLDRIFELFTRVDSSTSRQSQWGMGVGLALVRGFVELHGGTIKAISPAGTDGRGSEFVVHLPLSRNVSKMEQASQDISPQTAAVVDRPRKVLIAEDHEDSAQGMAHMLKMWHHDVRVVNNGPEALSAAREFMPDVLLLDIGLPGLDGYEVAKELRKQPMFRETPIFALTGYGSEEDRKRAADAGFSSHLVKPVDPDTLRKLLSR